MTSLAPKALAAHVVVTLSHAQAEGRSIRLDEIAASIGVRKEDIRGVISRLHNEGHVDALRMRLTMSGLALAASFAPCTLHTIRREPVMLRRVA
jgi:DNA-binding IscR family transcriptional regulator